MQVKKKVKKRLKILTFFNPMVVHQLMSLSWYFPSASVVELAITTNPMPESSIITLGV